MHAPRSTSRNSSFASTTDTGASAHNNAALLGAATAFGRSASRPGLPNRGSRAEGNGGLAVPSARPRQAQPQSMILPQFTGESGRSVKMGEERDGAAPAGRQALHKAPSISPSLQAASLASARAPPAEASPAGGDLPLRRAKTTKGPAAPPKPRRLSSYNPAAGDLATERPTDSSPIPPTTSLVQLFERKASRSETPNKRPGPLAIRPSSDLAISSPKPIRSSGGITSMFQMQMTEAEQQYHTSEESRRRSPTRLTRTQTETSGDYVSASEELDERPAVDKPRNQQKPQTARPSSVSKDVRPSSPAPRTSITKPVDIPRQLPGNSIRRAETLSPSSASVRSLPAQYHTMYPARKMTPNMTGDQLANAIVAGSLASMRAPSPRKTEPPPPPTRRHKHGLSFSRTPSPTKTGMLHTLRKTEADSSDDEETEGLHPYGKHKKKRLVRKHPNKHHEGDRKRWRDAVTERERKRYEGVWAANKGLYITFTPEEQKRFRQAPNSQHIREAKEVAAESVCNLVVRDIWNRSRLPSATLEMIWDLVDEEGVGRLTKEEFVVGMWLIDQRLKGRKLPVKVSETVWASVRGLQGIKIRKS